VTSQKNDNLQLQLRKHDSACVKDLRILYGTRTSYFPAVQIFIEINSCLVRVVNVSNSPEVTFM
jgi:hypothetical protein